MTHHTYSARVQGQTVEADSLTLAVRAVEAAAGLPADSTHTTQVSGDAWLVHADDRDAFAVARIVLRDATVDAAEIIRAQARADYDTLGAEGRPSFADALEVWFDIDNSANAAVAALGHEVAERVYSEEWDALIREGAS